MTIVKICHADIISAFMLPTIARNTWNLFRNYRWPDSQTSAVSYLGSSFRIITDVHPMRLRQRLVGRFQPAFAFSTHNPNQTTANAPQHFQTQQLPITCLATAGRGHVRGVGSGKIEEITRLPSFTQVPVHSFPSFSSRFSPSRTIALGFSTAAAPLLPRRPRPRPPGASRLPQRGGKARR
jgi:hypothetical protein